MSFDFTASVAIVAATLFIASFLYRSRIGQWPRLFSSAFIAGLLLYSGIGASYRSVPSQYVTYYFIFLIAFCISYRLFLIIWLPVGHRIGRIVSIRSCSIDYQKRWGIIVLCYIVLQAAPLIYPNFRLSLLINPPHVDLIKHFANGAELQTDAFLKLAFYAQLLLTPFFYIALFKCRKNIIYIIIIISLLLYIRYVDIAYISRGALLISLILICFTIWYFKPWLRVPMVIFGVAMLPLLFVALYSYQVVRVGGEVDKVDIKSAAEAILDVEAGFPRDVGVPIIESGRRADFGQYIKWIATIPIPKIITGPISGSRVNTEISEIVLGKAVGEPGYYVVLPGLVSEAIYLYGTWWYWLHAVFISAMMALFVRVFERVPQAFFILLSTGLSFAYDLNRGGIGAFLPDFINSFLLFFFWLSLFGFKLIPLRSINKIYRGYTVKSNG